MNKTTHNIKVYRHSSHNNFFEGIIDDEKWFAIVKDDEMEDAIDPNTLKKGSGKIVRLCIYKDSRDIEGNPYLPSVTIRRTIYANFINEWKILNLTYRDKVRALVKYLNRIKSFHIVD